MGQVLTERSLDEHFVAGAVVPPSVREAKQLVLSDGERFRRFCNVADAGGNVTPETADEPRT